MAIDLTTMAPLGAIQFGGLWMGRVLAEALPAELLPRPRVDQFARVAMATLGERLRLIEATDASRAPGHHRVAQSQIAPQRNTPLLLLQDSPTS